MQVRKEEACGRLYLAYQYGYGVIRRQTPRERAARKRKTTEAKQIINRLQRKYELMRLLGVNFAPGRDLFVCLEWDHEPTAREDANALRAFWRRLRRAYDALGVAMKYICVTETHGRDGSPARLHHHIILTGLTGRDLALVLRAWPYGGVDVRTLRELTDNFEDTCEYLLKERKPEGKRAYSCSQNLDRPPEPLRRRVREQDRAETPPGVRLVWDRSDYNDFGGYQILVGKIIDPVAFGRYWDRAKADRRRLKERESWRRIARRKAVGRKPQSGSKSSLTSEQEGSEGIGQ